jgi:hypothetical protein
MDIFKVLDKWEGPCVHAKRKIEISAGPNGGFKVRAKAGYLEQETDVLYGTKFIDVSVVIVNLTVIPVPDKKFHADQKPITIKTGAEEHTISLSFSEGEQAAEDPQLGEAVTAFGEEVANKVTPLEMLTYKVDEIYKMMQVMMSNFN